MNIVEKVLDGVQNLINVNSATFSGAVDIIVIPQEDGTLACTSWHVRFGKLQLLNTSEKKILIEVNGVPVRGMKMRLGRAGEAYFVGETNEPPPPEFRASIDPDHGLSDEEDEFADIRATHDDWAAHDELHQKVVQTELDPPVEGNWAEFTPRNRDDEPSSHLRHKSAEQLRTSDPELSTAIQRNASTDAVSSPGAILPTSSADKSGAILLSPAKRRTREAKSAETDRKGEDTRSSSPYASDTESTGQDSSRDRSNPFEALSSSQDASSSKRLTRSAAAPSSTSKSTGKSWGAALLGFLGKKDQVDEQQSQDTPALAEEKRLQSAASSSAVPIASSGRRTSFDNINDIGSKQSNIFGDEIHSNGTASGNTSAGDVRHVQSSSLPNHWGPSPLLTTGISSASGSSRPNDDDYASDGGSRLRSEDDGKSRAADDGSGVIFVGQKRKNRSASITLATPLNQPATSPASSLVLPDSSARPPPSSSMSLQDLPGNQKQTSSGSSNILLDPPKRSKSSERITTHISSAVSDASMESDVDDDAMFEMDEEAYQAANPMSHVQATLAHITVLTEGADVARSPPNSRKPLIEISKCGFSAVASHESDSSAAAEAFNAGKLTWHGFNEDPNILFAPDIVFRIGGSYYPLAAAAPMLFSVALYTTPLSSKSVDRLLTQSKPKSASKSWGRWFAWGKPDGSTTAESKKSHEHKSAASSSATAPTTPATRADRREKSSTAHPPTSTQGNRGASGADSSDEASYTNAASSLSPRTHQSRSRTGSKPPRANGSASSIAPLSSSSMRDTATEPQDGSDNQLSSPASSSSIPSPNTITPPGTSSTNTVESKNRYYVRTLKPSPERLKSLNLKPGPNKIVFSVDSRLQGLQQVSSTVYLWDRESKVVISDIDGTITKSDVLGQIFPVFGKDWSHSGVAALFQSIKANGYEILYLTARAIGAASITKGFLTSLQQDSIRLPDGPVFMSPDRLLHSLNREVILRRPEQFKIQCLNEIRSLFQGPSNADSNNPFYAGFGNRETDAVSYTAVGIPVGKTFTINPSGEITGHSKSIQRTYTMINELVEQMFPPYHKKKTSQNKPAEQWNDFQFWDTRPAFSLDDLEKELLK